jgi:hypothetical protein
MTARESTVGKGAVIGSEALEAGRGDVVDDEDHADRGASAVPTAGATAVRCGHPRIAV